MYKPLAQYILDVSGYAHVYRVFELTRFICIKYQEMHIAVCSKVYVLQMSADTLEN